LGIAAQSGGIKKAVNYGIKTLTQVVISLKELIDPEDKTEIGKPTITSLEIKPLSIGCGNPKTDRS
jgi:hypothetical protein